MVQSRPNVVDAERGCRALLALTVLCITACAAEPSTALDESVEGYGLPGYVHTYAHSHFHLGTFLRTTDDGGTSSVVGSAGVFATELPSMSAYALPNQTFIDVARGLAPPYPRQATMSWWTRPPHVPRLEP
jgi:hypothetical protein